MTYSRVTLEPLPEPEQIFKDMVQLYLDEKGYGDLFDVYKVLLPERPSEIGIKLFEQIEDINNIEMQKVGRCPDCGCELKDHEDDFGRVYLECPECLSDYGLSEVE